MAAKNTTSEQTTMTLEEALEKIELLETQLANALAIIERHNKAEQTKKERRRERRQIRKAKEKALKVIAQQQGVIDDEGNLLIDDDDLTDDI